MYLSAENALKHLKSKDHVFIHSAAAAPKILIDAMTKRHRELKEVSIYQMHTEGDAPYANPEYQSSFLIKAFFVGANMRASIQSGRGSYIPIFLSEIPKLFRKNVIPLDIALITISPPDQDGICSLGTSVDISLAAIESAKIVIAQVNKFMPRTYGDALISLDKINFLVEGNIELHEINYPKPNLNSIKIGQNIAELIEDGATLQMGIGSIPNAVLDCLNNHKNLGMHSEMFSDGALPLIEKGIINNEQKVNHTGKIVSSFIIGSRKLYKFLDNNKMVEMLTADYVNNPDIIRQNPKVTAINSAIEIDLTGQVCADSIGSKIYSGVGGQMDFMRGASLSEGGKPIIALPSTTKNGDSKIVPFLKQGAGVVTTRAHVHYVVTEYGVASLYGKTIEERVKLLINIAHPKHREELEKASKKIFA